MTTFHPLPDPWPTAQDLEAHKRDQQPAITLSRRQLHNLLRMLADVDEFVRSGYDAHAALTGFYRDRGHRWPEYAVGLLIDDVGFTLGGLQHHTGNPSKEPDDD